MTTRPAVWPLLAAALALSALSASAAERNAWPFWVGIEDETTGEVTAHHALGPLITHQQGRDGAERRVWRPFFLWQQAAGTETAHLLYPLFSWQRQEHHTSFTFFQLINFRQVAAAGARGADVRTFEAWPIYFSRQTGDPETSYRGVFPIAGTLKNRLGKEEITWRAFPLYGRITDRGGRHTTHAPWPFLRFIDGNGHRGFEFWPLFGSRGRENDYRDQFALWPLLYRQERQLDEPTPRVSYGFLPFYTRDTGPGFINENYLWPFFGYTDRTEPQRYHETRYFWPFAVQGRGDQRHVNRWAPFYTHSIVKGYEKTWVMWPLYRRGEWEGDGVAQERHQVLFFLYWSNTQRSLTNPDAAPAYKKHFWPLASVWDNGAGRRQLQLFSPLEVFFPHNEPVRQVYSPLFAVYRYDRRAPDDVHWSLLWRAVSRTRSPQERQFNLGPLFGSRHTAEHSRVTLGAGLLSWRRSAGEQRWKFSVFDFRRPRARPAPAASSP